MLHKGSESLLEPGLLESKQPRFDTNDRFDFSVFGVQFDCVLEIAGRLQFAMLIREGVYPSSKVLDIGCGCLRGGYWLIHFLGSFGLEPRV
jgi:hypothetical protein